MVKFTPNVTRRALSYSGTLFYEKRNVVILERYPSWSVTHFNIQKIFVLYAQTNASTFEKVYTISLSLIASIVWQNFLSKVSKLS